MNWRAILSPSLFRDGIRRRAANLAQQRVHRRDFGLEVRHGLLGALALDAAQLGGVGARPLGGPGVQVFHSLLQARNQPAGLGGQLVGTT